MRLGNRPYKNQKITDVNLPSHELHFVQAMYKEMKMIENKFTLQKWLFGWLAVFMTTKENKVPVGKTEKLQ